MHSPCERVYDSDRIVLHPLMDMTTPAAHNRRKGSGFLALCVVIVLIFVIVKWQMAEKKLSQLTQGGQQNLQDTARANEIIGKVKKLMDIDDTTPPTVASIVNVDLLKAKNPFYAKARNGDFLLITNTRAILYDPDKNQIIDVVAVQITSSSSSSAGKITPKK